MTGPWASVTGIREAVRTRAVSAREVVQAAVVRARDLEPTLHSFVTLDVAGALAAADAVDRKVRRGQPLGALAGVPVGVKDLLATRGLRTTAGSRILAEYVPPYDATAVARLRAADAIIIGKTNLDEFAMGSSTETSAFGPTRNPWNPERIPGGSSGGSAAAVAAGQVCVSLGTDTGGSIRQPAALCGVLGLKPTWGRVSRYGCIAYASSLDQIGPLARSVRDLATTLGVIAGPDPSDATCAAAAVPDYLAGLDGGIAGLRVGVARAWMGDGLDPEVRSGVEAALDTLVSQGAVLVDVPLPDTELALATYYVLAPAEASSNLARYDGVRFGLRVPGSELAEMYEATRGEGFGPEVKRRIVLGTYALSAGYYDAYYGRAQRVRTVIRRQLDAAFALCDVIATPTSPVPAPRLGERLGDPLAMYLMDVYTISANLAGICGLSAPCGFTSDGLPLGLQLLGPAFSEPTVLRVAAAFEQATDHHTRHPEVVP